MSLTINRPERAWLAFLIAYRLSAADELRLHRVREQGATRGQLAREFDEDARLLDDLGWFDRELRDELGIPGAEHEDHELTALTDSEVRDTLMWLYAEGMSKSRRYPGGRSTTLKPAYEPIVLARAPLTGTTEETIERHGTGALNAEACRVGDRHPANVVLGHARACEEERCAADCPVATADSACAAEGRTHPRLEPSRFLYRPKARREEREAGCETLPARALDLFPNGGTSGDARNPHPCVKPLELMRWLVRLACPPGGIVLDPTCGSGSTGAAAVLEGRDFIGIEKEPIYVEIAEARIAHWSKVVGHRWGVAL